MQEPGHTHTSQRSTKDKKGPRMGDVDRQRVGRKPTKRTEAREPYEREAIADGWKSGPTQNRGGLDQSGAVNPHTPAEHVSFFWPSMVRHGCLVGKSHRRGCGWRGVCGNSTPLPFSGLFFFILFFTGMFLVNSLFFLFFFFSFS